MDPASGASTIGQALELATKVPGLLPLLLSAFSFVAVAAVLVGFWARGLVRWPDFEEAMKKNNELTLIENSEKSVDSNSAMAMAEVRATSEKVDTHLGRFEGLIDRLMELVNNSKTQVASLAAIVEMIQKRF
jgi:hypothetical protein